MSTIWVSTSSHRARSRLAVAVGGNPGPEYGIWPEGGWPHGAYYEVPARHATAIGRIQGLRVLRDKPSGGRLFKRLTAAEMGSPERGNWPVPS